LLCLIPSALQAGEVKIFAAASLKEAITEICAAFKKTAPKTSFFNNFGSSGALSRQLENGAPADIFASANQGWSDYLTSKSLLDKKSANLLAYNELVFAGKHNPKISSIQDLPRLERVAIGSPRSVPAGEYAMEALNKAGLESKMRGKLVMARDVRECLMYAERNEVEGAFIYKTDLRQARQASLLFVVPQELYPKVTYTVALTVSGAANAEAKAFHRFLQSPLAKSILKKHGFGTP
jgi:molybdate transport system substrate-binding protein